MIKAMRKRAGALIVQDRKLLLICEGQQDFYWTPGGGLEEGETYLKALRRELSEELGAELGSATFYLRIKDEAANEIVQYYLVTLTSLPASPHQDLELYWYTKQDFADNTLKISTRIFTRVFPKLLIDDLV
jgi:ADP-ribose pyrophosphatase YjhB (NUDIX family)